MMNAEYRRRSKLLVAALCLAELTLSLACSKKADYWQTVEITSNNSIKITINPWDDPSEVIIKSWHGADPSVQVKTVDTIKVVFKRETRDSIADIVKDLIEHPVQTDRFCTDYVGNLELKRVHGQVTQNIRYASICDWSTLSPETETLHAILKRHIKEIR